MNNLIPHHDHHDHICDDDIIIRLAVEALMKNETETMQSKVRFQLFVLMMMV
jgi:hypothetical protein